MSAFLFSGPSVAAASALRWIRLAEALFPVFFVLQRIKDPEAALRLCSRVFLVSGLLAAAFGIAQFFLGFDLAGTFWGRDYRGNAQEPRQSG